jgi:prepilin-type N-terminal cleavage/methylation domain-containing protein
MLANYKIQNGFTLIEMMITLVVVAVLLAVVAPSFNDFFVKNRLKQAAEEIYGLMAKAKAETVTRNMDLTLNVDSGAWCVGYAAAAGCTCSPVPAPDDVGACAVPVGSPAVNVLQVIDGADFTDVNVTSGDMGFTFDSVRGTTAANTINLTAGAWSLNVVVSPAGRVRLCAPDGNRTMGYPQC